MPELPEVESIRRYLDPILPGRTVQRALVLHPRLLRYQPGGDFEHRMSGRTISEVGRRGKYLIVDLTDDLTWVTHLGMSGRIKLEDQETQPQPHTHVRVGFDEPDEFRMIDPRTFGYVVALTPDELATHTLAKLGPDALDDLPSFSELRTSLSGRTAAIKSLLLDQKFIAGIGNIYADEILHRARIRGDRPGGSLKDDDIRRLRNSVRPVLEAGLRWSGTSLGDLAYLLPDGRTGEFQDRLSVYGREDEPCPRCGSPIRRKKIRDRSSFYCEVCQA